jgi:hypothetical protein
VRVCAAGVNPVDAQNRSDGSWAFAAAPVSTVLDDLSQRS